MPEPRIVKTPRPNNRFYYGFGLAVLALNKVRHSVQGYRTPRTFPMIEINRAVDYDISVVDHWLKMLQQYTRIKPDLTGATILELGPGADLGVGLLLLALGAKKYNAIDINNLVQNVPQQFYDAFFDDPRVCNANVRSNVNDLRAQLKLTQAGQNDRLNYICRSDFDVSIFSGEPIDLVFSQAAFEHFDNIDATFLKLGEVARSGTVLVTEIDLNTHTRWLRDVDPLNIYRYSDAIYDAFRFRGSPNRHRPQEYKQALEKHGWENVQIWPLTRVDDEYTSRVRRLLPAKFRLESSQIEYLSIALCAQKK